MTDRLSPGPTEIVTASGQLVDLVDPKSDDISIRDIAAALAKTMRLNGSTRLPYTVAQHCVHVAELAFKFTNNPRTACHGMIHDAHQAYIGHIATPIKTALIHFGDAAEDNPVRALEFRFDVAIYLRFGLERCLDGCEVVSLVDKAVVQAEFRDLMPADVLYPWDLDPAPIAIKPWPWDKAEERYLNAWDKFSTLANLPD